MQRLSKLISSWQHRLLPVGTAGSARDAADAADAAARDAAAQAVQTGGSRCWRREQRLLVSARVLALVGMAAALAGLDWAPDNHLIITALAFGVAPFAAFNMLALIRLRRHSGLSDQRFMREILTDIVVLGVLLGASGGAANPFHDMFFLPMVVAATSLPAARVLRTTLFGVGCFWLISVVYLPLPGDAATLARLQTVGGFINHTLLAGLLSYFVVHICGSLRHTQRRLAEMSERELRAGYAVALGSVAAGAAHELGTPLSTISTVVGELRQDHAHQPELQRSLELLQGSVGACIKSLDSLRLAGDTWMAGDDPVPADRLFETVVSRFQSMRPGAQVRLQFESAAPAPQVVADMALQQAVINLLSNAAYVSPLDVCLSVAWDASELRLRVSDRGPGFPPELSARLGQACVTGKPPGEGCGVGLFLTQVTINRLSGRLQLGNAPEGGAVASICVPLSSLRKRNLADG